ncbi:MAG: alanine racemase [Spirochaetales bacterium]|nr:alanine racemase [Spirochaetales bacterium]
MYLDNVLLRNEKMLKDVMELHQNGEIPVNSWVINLDLIAKNCSELSKNAKINNLKTYIMSKQHNRNPYINSLAIKMGLNKVVAVDFQGALACRDYKIPLGHAGHLNQIPRNLVKEVVKLKPEVITVYNLEHAEWINDAAKKQGKIQNILIRVFNDNDSSFLGQEGGFHISDITPFINQIQSFTNIKLIGVTAFPCLKYNENLDDKIVPTSNVDAIYEAIDILKNNGIKVEHVNMPGNTSSSEMKLLKKLGATHVEPGNAILGTTPSNAFNPDLPEQTAICYLTEISHKYKDRYYAYGGGCYHTNYSDKMYAMIGKNWNQAKANGKVYYNHNIIQDIDYHMQFVPTNNQQIEIGDSVIGVYRTQMHMTRSYHVAVSGMSGDRPLKVHYILDNGRNPMDKDLNPVSRTTVIKDIKKLLKTY